MKKKVLGIFLVLSMVAISAEKNIETKIQNENGLIKKVEKNELAIDTIKKQYSVDLKEIENKYEAKVLKINNEKEEIKLEKDEIIRNFNSLDFLIKLLGSFSLIGIIAGFIYYFKLWKKIDNKIQEEADKKIKYQVEKEIGDKTAKIVKCEKEKIIEIVKKYDEEWRLKQNKKICVLSLDSIKENNINKILKEFKKVTYKNIEKIKNIENIELKNYDLILINDNKNDKDDLIEINNIIESNEDILFLYYGLKTVSFSKNNVNGCKSIFTLYGNLIDLLRTQDLLKK